MKMIFRVMLAGACLAAAASGSARANSYASSLTNNAGEISFRLNNAADSVKVTGNNGALTIDLGPLPRGLTVTNLAAQGLTAGTFKVTVVKLGSGAPALIGSSLPFNSPRGVAVNNNPASPNFGRVYVANSAAGGTGANARGDGLYAYSADLFDVLGQNGVARTGGITNFTKGGGSSPYRLKVGRDDGNLYVADWSDGSGNLYLVDPDLTDSPNTSYVLKQLTGTIASPAVLPVGPDNTHGSVAAVEVIGKLADGTLQVFTIDEDYQGDPTASGAYELNSLWRYDVGAGPLPFQDPPAAKLGTPIINFVSQTMDLSYLPSMGYFYISQMRSAGNERGVFVVDSEGTLLWDSRAESLASGLAVDALLAVQGVAVSQDGRFLATMGNNNVVTIVPMTNGLPNLPNRFQYTGFATTTSGRGIAFDAADNLYVVSSGLGILQSLSLGFTGTNVTSSDGTFTLTVPDTQVNATLLDPDGTIVDTLVESDPGVIASFRIARSNTGFSEPLPVNFSLTGTATRGTASTGDYSVRTNGVVVTNSTTVTIPAGSENLVLEIVANDDNVSELTETIIFGLTGGGGYDTAAPRGGTIRITDNDAPMIEISAVTFNTMYEGNPNDLVRYTVQRRGDTNVGSFDVNFNYGGTATKDVDYTSVATVTIDPGVITTTVSINPLDDSIVEIPETIVLSIAPAGAGNAYLVGTNLVLTAGATSTIVDDDQPAETVLFSDDFNLDTSENWDLRFGSTNSETFDYTAIFSYNYGDLGIPPAPNSGGDTAGLYLTVNKSGLINAAGLNAYPKNAPVFTGNFALRFDMYILQNGSAGTTEGAIFGINHSGNNTNWFRNSETGGIRGVPTGWTYDGLWEYVVADASALGYGDFVLFSSPTTGGTALTGPTPLATRLASTLTQTFHRPPWSAGGGAGSPGNSITTTTPSWAEVEVSQIGNLVTVKINNTVISSITNKTAFTSGNIMLGYNDAYDSTGSGGGGVVIYDNVRVIRLADGINITSFTNAGVSGTTGLATLDFTGFANEPASAFKLTTSTNVAGPYKDDTNNATAYSVTTPGVSYRVTTPTTTTNNAFFQIRKL